MKAKNRTVLMLSYQRANRLKTYRMFQKLKFEGQFFCVVSDDDEQIEEYRRIFGENLIVFNRDEVDVDYMVNWRGKGVVNARNFVQKWAERNGIKEYVVVDDDYENVGFRWNAKKEFLLKERWISDINKVIDFHFDFLKKTGLGCVAMAQSGDFLGGRATKFEDYIKRKIYNFYFFTDTSIRFFGIYNEDAVASVYYGRRGKLLLMLPFFSVKQTKTQQNEGGLTDLYKQKGMYMKSFLPILICPIGVKVRPMGEAYLRWHHKIEWKKICPKIVRDKNFFREKIEKKNLKSFVEQKRKQEK